MALALTAPPLLHKLCVVHASLWRHCHCVTTLVSPPGHTPHTWIVRRREREMHAVLLIFHPFFFFFFIFCSTGCYLFVVAECMVYMRVCHIWCFLAQPDSSWQTATFQQVCLVKLKNYLTVSNISACFCHVEKQKPSLVDKQHFSKHVQLGWKAIARSCWPTATFHQACSVKLKN